MRAYQEGDVRAFETLYQRHSGKVLAYLRKRLARREEAEEVFQQVFTKLHRSRAGYDSSYAFTQWLFVITKSVLLDHWYRENKQLGRPESVPFEESEAMLAPAHSPIQALESAAAFEPEALSSLPPEQRRVVEWRVLDELSYREIAERLDRSQVSVRQMLSRALRRLRQAAGEKSSVGKGGSHDQ